MSKSLLKELLGVFWEKFNFIVFLHGSLVLLFSIYIFLFTCVLK